MGMGDRHGGWWTAGGRISLSSAGAGALGRKPGLEDGARAQPRKTSLALALVALLLAFAPPSPFAFLQIGRPAAGLALQ